MEEGLELGSFRMDTTPPSGCGVGLGLAERATGVRDPLYLRGFVLRVGTEATVVAVADWCGIMNGAYRELQAALAEGAGVPPERVIVHSTHQHDAPLFAFEVELLLGRPTYPRPYWKGVLEGAREQAALARARTRPIAHIGYAQTPVEGYASARRVVDRHGKLLGSRWSRTADAGLVAQPEGTIDPLLRTIAFRAPDGEIASTWSFYGTHPQVSNGRLLYSADAPGEAMRLLGLTEGITDNAFFMGCAGNVSAGKYTSLTDLEGNLLRFGAKLADAIRRNLVGMRWSAAGSMGWREASFRFPAEPGREARLRAQLADSGVPESRKQISAPVLACMKDPHNATYRLALLDLGGARVLFLPGEPFVEYQLYAMGLAGKRHLTIASNCNDSPCYLPRAVSFLEGGYEVESYCWCTPEIEPLLEGAIRAILA